MRAVALLLATSLLGCSAAPALRQPQLGVPVPAHWTTERGVEGVKRAVDRVWWKDFDDPALSKVIEEALRANHDLEAASARVAAASASARIAGADALPAANLSFNGSRAQRTFIGFPFGVAGGGGGGSSAPAQRTVISSRSNQFGVALDVSWELDLWGRVRAGRKAAVGDLQAARADLAAARVSIAAQTAKAWFGAVEAERQLELARRTAASYRGSLNRVDERYRLGLSSALDVRLARTELHREEAVVERRNSNLDRARRQLEILLGRYPAREVETSDRLAQPVGAVPAGLPARLLVRRPDLSAAERRLAAAGARVYAARAALLPRISLTGSYGTSSAELSQVLDQKLDVWTIAGNLLQPVFQGGRLRAQVDLARAREKELLADYASSTLRAFAEVESLLADEGYLARRTQALAAAAENARASRQLSEERYQKGLEDYTTVLSAQRSAFDAQSALLQARRERIDTRVDLYLALGGGFSREQLFGDASSPVTKTAGGSS